MRTDIDVVVGAQAGSEGKGAVCGWLADKRDYYFAIRVGGPNAGHNVVDRTGQKWALQQLPVAAVMDISTALVIGPGSEVDLEILRREIRELEAAGFRVKDRLYIDREATVVESAYMDAEQEITTGTTGKGIGAARAARAMRKATRMGDLKWEEGDSLHVLDTQPMVRESARMGRRILLEGAQGYVLGSHAGMYPYCTSIDCRAIDFLAMAGLPPATARVFVVARTHPIRIAGESGPLEGETTWTEIGVPAEQTTVTKKVRRVGRWNGEWVKNAIEANHGVGGIVFWLSFADYVWPELSGVEDEAALHHLGPDVMAGVTEIEKELKIPVGVLGTGPNSAITLIGRMEALER